MMKTRDLTLLILFVLGITFLLSFTFLHCEIPKNTASLTGKVEWVKINKSNQVTLVAIATQTEDYLVGDDGKGRELLQLVNKRVNVRGRITEDEHGQKTVIVSAYKIVPQ